MPTVVDMPDVVTETNEEVNRSYKPDLGIICGNNTHCIQGAYPWN